MIRAGFGETGKKEEPYEKYVGKYAILYVQGRQESFSGRVNSIDEGYLVLNPFSGGEWDSEKGLIRKLVYEDSTIRISDISAIEPVSRTSLKNYLEYLNRQREKSSQENKNSK